MRSSLILLVFTICTLTATGQRRIRVLDVETHEPVVNASVEPNRGERTQTDSLGYAPIPEVFDSLFISHVKYEREKLTFQEVKDTVYLFATENMLDDVTVVSPQTMMNSLQKQLKTQPLPDPGKAAISIPLSKILKWFGYKSKREKKKERVKRILEGLGGPTEEEKE